MAKQSINIGTSANDRTGDSLRSAFNKINENFTDLYTALGLDEGSLNLGAFEFTGSVLTTTDSSAIVIDQATTITSNLTVGGDVVPSVANGGDLGTADKPWRSLYVSGDTVFIGGTPIRIDGNGDLTVDGNVVASGVISYNDLTDTPTIPADIGDLTDTGSLLAHTDIGDITFTGSTMSAADDTNITVQALDINSEVRSRIILTPDIGAVSMNGYSNDSTTFDTNDWDTATWSSEFSGGAVVLVNALDIYNFIDQDLADASTIEFSINGGARQLVSGRGWNFPTSTLTLSTADVPDPDPTTVTEIEFFYTFSSSVSIDYDDGAISLDARGGMNIELRSDFDIRLSAGDDIRITGTDSFALRNESATDPIQIITDDFNNSYAWEFGANGSLTFPDATVQTTAYPGPQTTLDGDVAGSVFADDSTLLVDGVNGRIVGPVDSATITNSAGNLSITADNYVYIDSINDGQINIGTSSGIGDILLGDTANGTDVQILGRLFVKGGGVPVSSVGSDGDFEGIVAIDNNYIYYCTATYDGVTDIWKRVAWSGDTW